jgi:hypothetical protein
MAIVAIVRNECAYILIRRRAGKMGDLLTLPKKQRTLLGLIGASHVATDPGMNGWLDWYKVPIKIGGLNRLRAALRSRNILDGPFWGKEDNPNHFGGRVIQSSGAGAKTGNKAAIARRAKVKENERILCPLTACGLFSSADINAVRETPDILPSDWPLTPARWIALCTKHPLFGRLYIYLSNGLAAAQLADDIDASSRFATAMMKLDVWARDGIPLPNEVPDWA